MKVIKAGGQYQVVIGNEVSDVYDAVLKNSSIKGGAGGVTEPGVYGVLLRFKRPMILMCLVNGIGGALCGIFNVTRDVQIGVNLLTLPAVHAVYGICGTVAIVISLVGSFVLTFLFGYNDSMLKDEA